MNKNRTGIKQSFAYRMTRNIMVAIFTLNLFFTFIFNVIEYYTINMGEIKRYQEIQQTTKMACLNILNDTISEAKARSLLAAKLKEADDRFAKKWFNNPKDSIYRLHYFVIDEKGNYIIAPRADFSPGNRFLEDIKSEEKSTDIVIFNMMENVAEILNNLGIVNKNFSPDKEYLFKVINGKEMYIFTTPLDHRGWALATAVPALTIYYSIDVYTMLTLLLNIICMVVIFIVFHLTIRKVSAPLISFSDSAYEIAKGNFTTSLPQIKEKDEIGLLRDSFDHMQKSLVQYTEELKATTAAKAALDKELTIARDIQMSMVPKKFPPYPNRTDIDIYGCLTPAKSVGGDLFDFFLSNERLYFCIGDVSGKGVPASLFMTVARKLFRSLSADESKPENIIKKMNDVMSEGNDAMMFVTLFIGVLDLKSGRLDYCNGGHEAPILINEAGTNRLEVEANKVVGVMPFAEFIGQQTEIAPGTTIFLFTDGLTEGTLVKSENDKQLFGIERVMERARKAVTPEEREPRAFTELMLKDLSAFVGDSPQSDDLTLFAIQYKG